MKYLTDKQDSDAVNFLSPRKNNDIHHEVTVGDPAKTSFYLRVQNDGSEPAYRTNVKIKSFHGLSLPPYCAKVKRVGKNILYIFSAQ